MRAIRPPRTVPQSGSHQLVSVRLFRNRWDVTLAAMLTLAKTLADPEINNPTPANLPELCYDSAMSNLQWLWFGVHFRSFEVADTSFLELRAAAATRRAQAARSSTKVYVYLCYSYDVVRATFNGDLLFFL